MREPRLAPFADLPLSRSSASPPRPDSGRHGTVYHGEARELIEERANEIHAVWDKHFPG